MRWKRHLEVLRIAKIIFVNVRIIKIYTYLRSGFYNYPTKFFLNCNFQNTFKESHWHKELNDLEIA